MNSAVGSLPDNSTKDYGITILRVILTVWILLYHSFNEYFLDNPFDIQPHYSLEFMRGITNLALQAFMFISGLLLGRGYFINGKYHNKPIFIFDKIKRLLLPYLFWSLALVVFYNVSFQEVINGAKHLWFLLCLFDLMLLTILILPILLKTNKFIDITTVVIVCFLPTFINQIDFPNYIGFKNSISYLPSFLIGIFFVKYSWKNYFLKLDRKKILTLAALCVAATAVSVFTKSMPMGSLYLHLPYYFTPPMLYLLIFRYLRFTPISAFITDIDKNSLGIYILHQYVAKYTLMHYVHGYIEFYDRHYILAPILLFLFMFTAAWLTSNLLHKFKVGRIILGAHDKKPKLNAIKQPGIC